MRGDAPQIKALLLANIEALARHLCPEGRRAGAYWQFRSAAHETKIGGAWVKLTGAPGAWRDEVTGDKGDVFGLIARRAGVTGFAACLDWARGWLGLAGMSAAERAEKFKAAEQRARVAEAGRGEDEAKARRWAKAIYLEARRRPFFGSPADSYLKTRGIDVRRLGRMPGCLGWLPEGRHRESGRVLPVMVAGFTAHTGEIVSVHRTFLEPDGRCKGDVDPVRKMWPAMGGAAMYLWRGGSALSVREAAEAGLREPLVLTEGVEDGLSVALAMPEWRVWAAGSLANLAAIALPACCDEVIVAADNDWGKPQAARALDKALRHLAGQGVKVSVARSPIGKDFNDVLQAEGR